MTKNVNYSHKTKRPNCFTSKEGWKNIQLKITIIEVTLINDPLVTFWIYFCPKIHILPHDGEKGHFFKVDAWKPIDLVVDHTRIVYSFFFRSQEQLLKPHSSMTKVYSCFLASTGWFLHWHLHRLAWFKTRQI